MTPEMQEILIWILGTVSAIAVIGWIFTYLRLQGKLNGNFFVVNEDSLKVTYYFINEERHPELETLSEQALLENMPTYLQEAETEEGTEEYIHLITGAEIMVAKEDTFLVHTRRRPIRSIKPPPMRLIAIQIELVPKTPR